MVSLAAIHRPRTVACLGAHPDDIEIGAAGTLRLLADAWPETSFRFAIFATSPERAAEARASAVDLLGARVSVAVGGFADSLLPYGEAAAAKSWLRSLQLNPDLVLAPALDDRHQDHRFVGEVAWQVFRSATILEYEVPKWEGDRPTANLLVPLTEEALKAKLAHLRDHFPSQHSRPWYDEGVFEATARLRGIEAATTYAEGFVARKLILSEDRL